MSVYNLARLQSHWFPRQIEHRAEMASTNSRAMELAATSPATPLLVLCDRQSAGRGRGTNAWWSGEGAITCSVLFDAAEQKLPTERWPRVSLAAGVAVCETLQATVPALEVALKWPNDVHLAGRKVCGILVETPPRLGKLVVGLGLNVNNTLAAAPEALRKELRAKATSLVEASGVEFDLTGMLLLVLDRLAENLRLLADDEHSLAEKWQALSMLTGRTVELDLGSRRAGGVCRGIDTEGALLLHTEQGAERFFAGTVVAWRTP